MTPQRRTSEILRATAKAIAAQQDLPRSPGVMIGSKPVLCAGAAVVYQAGMKAFGPKELYRLASDMINAGTACILRKAAELGLDAKLVEFIVLNNDACADEDRHLRMASILSKLASGEDGNGEIPMTVAA
jgi:hypothetical protein